MAAILNTASCIDEKLTATHQQLVKEVEAFEKGDPLPPSLEEEKTDEHMAFVFEFVRHGARAPLEHKDVNLFSVGRS